MKKQFKNIFLISGLLSALYSLNAMDTVESMNSSDTHEVVPEALSEISDEQRQLLGQQLFELIRVGDNTAVKNLLKQGAKVDVVDADHSTPLFYAIRAGNLMALRLCLMHGADVFHVNKRGGMPYLSAVNRKVSQKILNYINLYEYEKIKKYKIEAIAQQINESRMSSSDKKEVIKRLTKLTLSYQCFEAVAQGNYNLAFELMENDINLNVTDSSNSTPLFYALRADVKNHEFIAHLLVHGADVFHVNNHGGIPYNSAVRHGADREIIKLIEFYEIAHMRNDFENVIGQLKSSLGVAVKEEVIRRLTQLHLEDANSLTLFEKIYGVSQVVDYSARYTDFPGK
jgi:ankyrin repeat protein